MKESISDAAMKTFLHSANRPVYTFGRKVVAKMKIISGDSKSENDAAIDESAPELQDPR